jgi:hypothetical protein
LALVELATCAEICAVMAVGEIDWIGARQPSK